ncbi:hypothetical protein [Streptomyces sp. NPDC059874]|uniref:hypothetical protein n=1 Tax=Streptomyces sp. NPDC059874 TaxID=3346983 RepID=UPI003662066C
MSFGDPNNPYGQQPPQGQPGYGYPQQAPQGIPPQGGYAYPQQQAPMGYPAGPGGYPGAPMEMPGLLKTARVLLFIVAGIQIIIGFFVLAGAAAVSGATDSSAADFGAGVLAGLGILVFALAAWAIVLGVKFAKGGSGVRITTIVYASLMLLGSLGNFANASNGTPGAVPGAIVGLAIFGLILAGAISGGAWFNRPRY